MFWRELRHGPGMVGEQRRQLRLAEAAALDEAEIVDQHAFLVDRRGARRHRAGRGAADIGVVAARGDPEEDLPPAVVEHRRAHRDVGQMRAAIVGRVEREDVARMDVAALSRMIVSTERSIEPRCTGMCGALATSAPSPSKTAQEKSSRSLMLTE